MIAKLELEICAHSRETKLISKAEIYLTITDVRQD